MDGFYKCSNCGKDIPNKYDVCPFCKAPKPQQVQVEYDGYEEDSAGGSVVKKILIGVAVLFVFVAGFAAGSMTSRNTNNPENEPQKVVDAIHDNAEESKNEEQIGSSEEAQNEEESEMEDEVPSEYKLALKKAEMYSSTMHMSKQGVYDQLVSEYGEKFKPEAAQYAIDNMDADWNENALEKAEEYRKTTSMSNQAIYDQLISEYGEKFTEEEAQYAIDNLD